jgi:hypothetical protein
MLDIIVTVVVVASLGYALRAQSGDGAILRRPYANRYNDASGAREEHLG